MPPRGVESEKRKRQYEHIKESELKRERLKKLPNASPLLQSTKLGEKKAKPQAKSLIQNLFWSYQLIYRVVCEKNLYLNV